MRLPTTLALIHGLAGCTQSDIIVLRDASTGQITRCEQDTGSSLFPIIQTAINNSAAQSCASGYEAAYWQRMN